MPYSFLIKNYPGVSPQHHGIIGVASNVISILYKLATIDSVFSTFTVDKGGNTSKPFDVLNKSEKERESMSIELAEFILDNHRKSILKYYKESNPTIEFSDRTGVSAFFDFPISERELNGQFTLGIEDDRFITNVFNIEYNRQKYDLLADYEWFDSVLRAGVGHFNSKFAAVQLVGMTDRTAVSELRRPELLGWITYIKDNYKMKIPDQLDCAELEVWHEGKLISLGNKINITTKEDWQLAKDQVRHIMGQLEVI